jgi:CHAT domain-containing protein
MASARANQNRECSYYAVVMSVSSAQQALKSAIRAQESARSRHGDVVKKQGNLENDIAKLSERAAKASSPSLANNYLRQAEGKNRLLASARTDVSRRLTDANNADTKVRKAEEKLRTEEASERAAQKRKDEQLRRNADRKRKQDESTERSKRQREQREQKGAEQQRAANEAAQQRELSGLASRTSELEQKLLAAERRAAPPEVAVLFLAASPEDQPPLRLDKEIREIERRVRASDYREAIYFKTRMARQLSDLIQDLNEVKPAIVHFSGHGSNAELFFEDEDGNSHTLDNETLSKLLSAAPAGIRLAVFNSCESATQAQIAVKNVDVAIGMNTTIGDTDAKVFAGQFYNSLGFGLSVAEAFAQATLQIELEGSARGAAVPELFCAEGIDPEVIALVNPEATEFD